MARLGTSKIVSKSKTFWKHGKHAKIDPRLLNPPKPIRTTDWAGSIRQLFDR